MKPDLTPDEAEAVHATIRVLRRLVAQQGFEVTPELVVEGLRVKRAGEGTLKEFARRHGLVYGTLCARVLALERDEDSRARRRREDGP